jgi:agmatinase
MAQAARHLPAATPVFAKPVFDLSADGEIWDAVQRTGRTHAVLAGLETDVCVLHSALGLIERGLTVSAAVDALYAPEPDHQAGLERLRFHGVELVTTKGIYYDLTRTPARARSLRHQDPELSPTPPQLPPRTGRAEPGARGGLQVPRYTGLRTFAGTPGRTGAEGADAAVFGIPWDGSATFRPGARFGPEAVRSASALLRPYNPCLDVHVLDVLGIVDAGDAPTAPGYTEDTLERVTAFVRTLADGWAAPYGIGGDHSVTLAELRAAASIHGPLGLVQFDAHGDLWDSHFGHPYSHGTTIRRALDEGLVAAERTIQVGLRGSLPEPADALLSAQAGVDTITWDELATMSVEVFAARVEARLGSAPAFITFDVDFVDPAFCPGTGTPEAGGPSSYTALQLVRSLTGPRFVAGDVVEVAPPYDGPGQPTATLAATVLYELLSLHALRFNRDPTGSRRGHEPGTS